MERCKILLLLIILLILYSFYQSCNTLEGFTFNQMKNRSCEDDSTWYIEDNKGIKHTCSDIGTTASCYDIDAIGRDGWERCLKTCGICDNSIVSKAPMNIMAMFSGDPIETHGVVLNISSNRNWVGKQDGDGGDVRSAVGDSTFGKDIIRLTERVSSIEDIFDIMTGNIIKCQENNTNTESGSNKFYGCNGQVINCPSNKNDSIQRNYIEVEDGSVKFPAITASCDNIGTNKAINNEKCTNYILFDKIIDRDDTNLSADRNIVSLYDVCPHKCKDYGDVCGGDSVTQ